MWRCSVINVCVQSCSSFYRRIEWGYWSRNMEQTNLNYYCSSNTKKIFTKKNTHSYAFTLPINIYLLSVIMTLPSEHLSYAASLWNNWSRMLLDLTCPALQLVLSHSKYKERKKMELVIVSRNRWIVLTVIHSLSSLTQGCYIIKQFLKSISFIHFFLLQCSISFFYFSKKIKKIRFIKLLLLLKMF